MGEMKEMSLGEMSKFASSVVKGILKECDITSRVIELQNKKTFAELTKDQRNLEHEIDKWDDILYDIDEAQQAGEVPLWDDVKEMKVLEHSAAAQILQDVKWIKKRDEGNVEQMTEMIKWDIENRKFFKPAPFKFNEDIHKFMAQKNEAYRAMVNAPKAPPPKFHAT